MTHEFVVILINIRTRLFSVATLPCLALNVPWYVYDQDSLYIPKCVLIISESLYLSFSTYQKNLADRFQQTNFHINERDLPDHLQSLACILIYSKLIGITVTSVLFYLHQLYIFVYFIWFHMVCYKANQSIEQDSISYLL